MLLLLIKAVWGTVTGGRFPLGRLSGIRAIHGQTDRTKETRDWKDERAEALILLGNEIVFYICPKFFFHICPKFFLYFSFEMMSRTTWSKTNCHLVTNELIRRFRNGEKK